MLTDCAEFGTAEMSYGTDTSDRNRSLPTRYSYGRSHAIEAGDVVGEHRLAEQNFADPICARRRGRIAKLQEYRLPPSASVTSMLARERDVVPPVPSKSKHGSVTSTSSPVTSALCSMTAVHKQAVMMTTPPLPPATHEYDKLAVGNKDERFEAFLARIGKSSRSILRPTDPSPVPQNTVRKAPPLPAICNKPTHSSPSLLRPQRSLRNLVPVQTKTRSPSVTPCAKHQSSMNVRPVENPYILPDLDLGFDGDRHQHSAHRPDEPLSDIVQGLEISDSNASDSRSTLPNPTTISASEHSIELSNTSSHLTKSGRDLCSVVHLASPELARNERMAPIATGRRRSNYTARYNDPGQLADTKDAEEAHPGTFYKPDDRSSAIGLRSCPFSLLSYGSHRGSRARSSSVGASKCHKLPMHAIIKSCASDHARSATHHGSGRTDFRAGLAARVGASETTPLCPEQFTDTDDDTKYAYNGPASAASTETSGSGSLRPRSSVKAAETMGRPRSITPPTGTSGPISPHEQVFGTHRSSSISARPSSDNTWRNSPGQDTYAAPNNYITLAELRRQELIWELCRTEEAFVNGLQGVIRVFCDPLRMPGGEWITGIPIQITDFFDWLRDIASLHAVIASNMAGYAAAQGPLVTYIAEPFLVTLTSLKIHQAYLIAFEGVNELIKRLVEDKASELGEFIRIQQRLPYCGGMTLSSFLLKPVKRLMRYPLFFSQLLAFTPADHLDHPDTLKLNIDFDLIIRTMDEVMQREHEYAQLKTFAGHITGLPTGFKLAKRDRRLLTFGRLRRVYISERQQHILGIDTVTGTFSLLRGSANREFSVQSRPTTAGQALPRPDSVYSYGYETSSFATSLIRPTLPLITPLRPSVPSGSGNSISRSLASRLRASTSNGALRAISPHMSRLSHSGSKEAKGTPIHAFIFSDLVVFATRAVEPPTLKTSSSLCDLKASKLRTAMNDSSRSTATLLLGESRWEVHDDWGLARVIGVHDLADKSEDHPGLMSVDLLPIWTDSIAPSQDSIGDNEDDEDEERVYTRSKRNKKSAWKSAMRTRVFLAPVVATSQRKEVAQTSERNTLFRAFTALREDHERCTAMPTSGHIRSPSEIEAEIRANQLQSTSIARERQTTSALSGRTAATSSGALTCTEYSARHAAFRSFWSMRVQSVKCEILAEQARLGS